ncbi:MAG: flagellar hook-basal body complex protein FliE [Desulfovibrionales bacterium]|jgi:flagellar hook-basal body complex protein FliE|nr:flagellar hook-basal body complex protein FliE [Desulfovibrionales bacterium]
MPVNSIAMQAYQRAAQFKQEFNQTLAERTKADQPQENSFATTIKSSLKAVNDQKHESEDMIKSFAAGKTQNVHELMISMQKASVAMSMTSAVRTKVMSAYKEVMNMSI